MTPVGARRLAPTGAAGVLAAAYVIASPPSLDLAAHLFRAHLFAVQGFGLWDDQWYAGHDTLGYSIVFPAVSAALTPQLAAALAAVGTAAVLERLVSTHFGARAWPATLALGAATAIDLYTGRLALAFGALPAAGAIAALDAGTAGALGAACALAVLASLCSPVAGLFAALAAGGCGLGQLARTRRVRSAAGAAAVAACGLAPIGALAVAFPEDGREPFAVSALWPVLVVAVATIAAAPREAVALRAGAALYGAATLAAYLVASPVGSTITRLGTALAAPVALLVWWGRRPRLLALVLPALLYIGWQAPVSDVWSAASNPATNPGYYRPLLRFLARQAGPPFRIEIPFTASHWEADVVGSRFALARGWERQLDIADNPIFYGGRLDAATYRGWLHEDAIRFVALADAPLDSSAVREAALIRHGLPYLRLVMRSAHWQVYAVAHPTPIVSGVATLRTLGTDTLALTAGSPGAALVRVRFSPYWALGRGSGCVGADGPWTRLELTRPGPVALVMRFAMGRIGATSPRCSAGGV